MAIVFRILKKGDKREHFDAGDADLNDYLKEKAWQNQRRLRVGVTYVAVDDEQPDVVLGYYTLAMSGIPRRAFSDEDAKKLTPYGEIPVILIGRLAVDKRARGKGLGKALLMDALRNSVILGESVGCRGIVVDALQQSVDFYEKYGFANVGAATSGERPQKMFLDIRNVIKTQKSQSQSGG